MIQTLTMERDLQDFPQGTFALGVHKLYAERVTDFLMLNEEWEDKLEAKVLQVQDVKGVSRARRGFKVLLLEKIKRPIVGLSPFARQNISFAGRITHKSQSKTCIWNVLSDDFQIDTSLLRVDVYPRDQTESLCLSLQKASAEQLGLHEPSDPFEDGPISITKSASKCTHRCTIILFIDDRGVLCYYFGIMKRQRDEDRTLMDIKLNHEAATEVMLEPYNCVNGGENKQSIEATMPLSRAYYKLEQVWKDYLKRECLELQEGASCDLGACPGGWTQVLVHKMRVASVVAVDPGSLPDRVTRLPQVFHEKSTLSDAVLEPHGPFSVLVCDASMVWMVAMKQLCDFVPSKAAWQLPCAWVITLKLPFKTLGSIAYHVKKIHTTIPAQLEEIKEDMYPKDNVTVRHRIVHLMANSDSERTLIAIFERSKASNAQL